MIYLVKACTGEYESYSETILGYTEVIEHAHSLVSKLEEEYKDCLDKDYIDIDGNIFPNYYRDDYTNDKSYKIYVDYTGVWFRVELIEPLCSTI